ncbi:hypothetical protein [Sphingomonas solaris]|uniref:Gasdermin bGSDM n=1 Tax=Alterirhizorhabdus solaris TaxID=2529389 RepID=A0A558R9H9_9SPHN|nr:hypothetical protein [Sphingomonas solaris]TVV76040.1 hypothetical protein FOY91_05535 [Sphingomonas solaris]
MADQWTTHLAAKGYTGIGLPSPEFRLLTLIFERDGARGHENAFEQLAPGIAVKLPQPEQNVNLPAIAGERTRSVDVGAGIKILAGLIAALGGGTLGLEAGFKAARKLTFSYDGISSETLNAVALEQHLNGVAVPQPGLLRSWLDDHLYLITSVLRARKITVTGHSERDTNAKVDVPVISGAVGGSLTVKAGGADDSTVTFEGTTGVPFAAKLFQLQKTGSSSQARLTLKATKVGGVQILSQDSRGAATEEEFEAELAPAVLGWEPERAVEESQ